MNELLSKAFDMYAKRKNADIFLATLQALCGRQDWETVDLLIEAWHMMPVNTTLAKRELLLDLLGINNSTSIEYLEKRQMVPFQSWKGKQ